MSTIANYIKKQLLEKKATADKNNHQIEKIKKMPLNKIPNIRDFFDPSKFDLTTDVNEEMRVARFLPFSWGKENTIGLLPLEKALIMLNANPMDPFNVWSKVNWYDCIKLLIKYGADPNVRAEAPGSFPFLFYFLPVKHFQNSKIRKVVHLLLKNGANIVGRDKNGFAAMDWLIMANENLGTPFPSGKERSEKYESFFSINLNKIPEIPRQVTFETYLMSQPILAHWASLFYKHYTGMISSLKNSFGEIVFMTPNIVNIIALYETSYLIMDISLVLEENPRLFNKIKQSLCETLKVSYIQYNKKDLQKRDVVEFISLIFSNPESPKGNKEKKERIEQYQAKVGRQG